MFRKVLLYGMPVYLYGLELLLKTMANVHADSVATFPLKIRHLRPVVAWTHARCPHDAHGRDGGDQGSYWFPGQRPWHPKKTDGGAGGTVGGACRGLSLVCRNACST